METEVEDGDISVSVQKQKTRCRFCWKIDGMSLLFHKIDEETKLNFETLTSLQYESLSVDKDQFSCHECYRSLKEFCAFRDDLIRKHTKLSRLVGGRNNNIVENTEIDDETLDDDPGEQQYIYMIDSEHNTEDSSYVLLEEKENSENEEALIDEDLHYADINNLYEAQDISENRVKKRGQAWCWNTEMEVDLVRYQKLYCANKKSETAMYEKISIKFKKKNYPPISAKSLKYKFMQLQKDKALLRELHEKSKECAESNDESNSDGPMIGVTSICDERTRGKSKGKQAARSKTSWSEAMELILLYFMRKFKTQQPGISYNDLIKSVTMAMNLESHNVSECAVRYKFKKISLETGRLEKLMVKVKEYEKESGENEEKLAMVDLHLPNVGRNLHWSDEMKKALINHHEEAKSQSKKRDLWNIVAVRMKSDGFGAYTGPKLMFKYFNLMRDATWKKYSSSVNAESHGFKAFLVPSSKKLKNFK